MRDKPAARQGPPSASAVGVDSGHPQGPAQLGDNFRWGPLISRFFFFLMRYILLTVSVSNYHQPSKLGIAEATPQVPQRWVFKAALIYKRRCKSAPRGWTHINTPRLLSIPGISTAAENQRREHGVAHNPETANTDHDGDNGQLRARAEPGAC